MKVAIIGTAPSSQGLAPFNDPTWKIWPCSPGNFNRVPRADLWFEMHARADLIAPNNKVWAEPYLAWLRQQTFPIYVQAPIPEIPNGTVYPLAGALNEFSPYFMTSTIAYMMALAIMQGASEIGLWGIDMAVADEYNTQRAGCQHFILEARRRGIKVFIPPQSDLMSLAPLYGYIDDSPMAIKVAQRKRELQEQMRQAEQLLEDSKHKFAFFKGALDDLMYFERTWVTGHDSPATQAQLRRRPELEPVKLNGASKTNGNGESHVEQAEPARVEA